MPDKPSSAEKAATWGSVWWTLLAAGGFCAAIWVIAYVLPQSLFFRGVPPVPIRVNPPLFWMGLGGFITFAAVLWLLSNSGASNARSTAILVGPVVLSFGSVLASVHPGQGAHVSRDETIERAKPPERSFAVPIFFENGSDELLPVEVRKVQDVIELMQDCSIASPSIRGYASSRPFRKERNEDSDAENLRLANRRATAVRDALKDRAGIEVDFVPWETHAEMASKRRIRDRDLSDLLLSDKERLNRRVDIFWEQTSCFDVRPPAGGGVMQGAMRQ